MRARPEHITESVIKEAVTDGWGLTIEEVHYFPEGGGAHHWVARSRDARNWFVTCDDLGTKPWLGPDCDAVFEGLVRAYGTAIDLRTAGLSFVAAPRSKAVHRSWCRLRRMKPATAFLEVTRDEPGRALWASGPLSDV